MMDEVAFITATRFTRKRCVTVSDKTVLLNPSLLVMIVELVGSVARISNSSIDIKVEILLNKCIVIIEKKLFLEVSLL
jgi:acyl-CoA hydrolase